MINCDGFERRGKAIDTKAVGIEAVKRCPTIEHVFTVYRISKPEVQLVQPKLVILKFKVDANPDTSKRNIPIRYHTGSTMGIEGRKGSEYYPYQRNALKSPKQTSAKDPLIILYTSGTTGKPKGSRTRMRVFRSKRRRIWLSGRMSEGDAHFVVDGHRLDDGTVADLRRVD